ncbi:MAG: hypothetical protein QY318_02555 [Candidatus Dojkabacteria bacterium]|nr:MAG: hypothetical protein QY318_02555 [Candidatus Dojkabacteria bacterium]
MENEQKKDKSLQQLRMLTFMAVGSCIFFFYVAYMGFTGSLSIPGMEQDKGASVQGVNDSANDVVKLSQGTPASIQINNAEAESGTSTVEVKLSSPVNLAGAELYFEIEGNLQVAAVTCSALVTCISSEAKNGRVEIIALVSPDNAELFPAGVYELATIAYVPGTYGELKLDPQSTLLEIGSDQSILSDSNPHLAVGSY